MSIDKRSKGVYRFRVMHKGNNYSTTFYGSEKEAKRAHDEFVLDVKKGKFLQASDMTLRELWDLYLESRPLEAGTVKNHLFHMKSFDFLDMRVVDISKVFLKQYHNKHKKFADDLDYVSLRAVLSFGVEMDIIEVNPMSFRLRKVQRKKFEQVMTLEQAKVLLDGILKLKNVKYRAFLLIQLVLGTRYGETAGILRESVDMQDHILHIHHQYKDLGDVMGIGKTKTAYSERDIHILEFVRPYLYELVFATKPGDYVFRVRGDKPIMHFTINRVLGNLCASLGLPTITTHKLRKLSATISIYAGSDPLSVRDKLGHASLDMTEHYLLSMDEKKIEEAQKVDVFLKNLS